MARKTFYRSTTNRKVSGLVGGLSEYLDIDDNFLRLITLVIILMSGVIPGLIIYLIAAAFVPMPPQSPEKENTNA